jgi:DNA invertase Pin-like site-specific DNA recombinase
MTRIAYYMRTSTFLQNTDRQDEKVEDGWRLYKDKGVSGRIHFEERAMGKKLLSDAKNDLIDEVKVIHLDRLGRNTEDVLKTIRTLHEYNVSIHIIKQGIHTLVDGKENFTTKLLVTILTSISEMEYNLHRERILEGIRIAQMKGHYKGRVKGSTESIDTWSQKSNVKKVKTLLENGVSVRKIREILGVSYNFCYKVKSRLVDQQAA